MSYVCEICGKGRMAGRNVSHAKNRTVKSSIPNLHRVSLGRGKPQQRLCTDCLRRVKASIVRTKAEASS